MDGSTAAIQRGLMKAIVCRTHGRPDVLRLEEIDRPPVPDDGLLVRVHASSINPVDFFPLSRVAYTARLLSGGLKPKSKVLGIDAVFVAAGASANTVWGGNRTLRHLIGIRLA